MGINKISIDWSDQNLTEALLRESEEMSRKIIDQSIDGIMLSNEQGIVVLWNRGMTMITGIKIQDAIGTPIWDIKAKLIPSEQATPERIESLRMSIKNILDSKKAWPGEAKNQGIIANGENKVIKDFSFSIKTGKGKIYGCIIRDVTGETCKASYLSILGKISVPIIEQIRVPVLQVQVSAVSLRDYVVKHKDLQPYKDLEKIYDTSKKIEEVLQTLLKFIQPSDSLRSKNSLAGIFEFINTELQVEIKERKAIVNIDIGKQADEAIINSQEWQFILFQLAHLALEGLPEKGGTLNWAVRQREHELEIILSSKSQTPLNQVKIKCNRYNRIDAGDVDLKLLLAEKIIIDYGATISYQLIKNKQRTVILLPQKKNKISN